MREVKQKLPKGYSIKVQRFTEGPGYVALVFYYESGMRFAAQVSRAYGNTKAAAKKAAVNQVVTGNYNVL